MPTREACHYDASGVYVQPHGLPLGSLSTVAPRLNALRQAVMHEAARVCTFATSCDDPTSEQAAGSPLSMLTWLLMRPSDVLRVYEIHRRQSELERVLSIARVLTEEVDRLVVLGSGVSHAAVAAVFQSCCHPYHNEFSPGERAGGPRLYLDGHHCDHDARAAILDLLPQRPSAFKDERWGLIVASAGPQHEATAAALAEYLPRLRETCRDSEQFARRFVSIARPGDWLHRMAEENALGQPILLPPNSQMDSFGPATMLPLAAVGVDVVRYLRGAAAITERFRSTSLGLNPVLDLAGLGHLLATSKGLTKRIVARESMALAGLELWWQACQAAIEPACEANPPSTADATFASTSAVAARLASGKPMQIMQLVVESSRRHLGTLPPSIASAETQLADAARSAGLPLVRLLIPRANEACGGQVMQLLPAVVLCEQVLQTESKQG